MKKKGFSMDKEESERGVVTNLLANERTFLAWIRTSLGIMAFGFVVEKFAFFLRRISALIGDKANFPLSDSPTSSAGGAPSLSGIYIVAFGVLISLLAFLRYRKVENDLENKIYRPSQQLSCLLAGGVFLIGAFLIFYLIGMI